MNSIISSMWSRFCRCTTRLTVKATGSLANLLGQDDLIGMTLGPGDPLRRFRSRILEAQLNMVEPGVHQLRQPRLRNSQAGGDEVGIKAGLPSARNQLFQIGACRRLASGQVQMKHAKTARLLKHADPFCGRKFRLRRDQLQRIGAINAVQWAPMRDFGDQSQWVRNHQ